MSRNERDNKGKESETLILNSSSKESNSGAPYSWGNLIYIQVVNSIKKNENSGKEPSYISANNHILHQKTSTYDGRFQLIIITGSVVLLTSIVSILVVRSNLSIKLYHPTTSLSRNLFQLYVKIQIIFEPPFWICK
jgi:hypothetical protein